jgi:predicted molibdopterin-dependent oxidoreductase YjgC
MGENPLMSEPNLRHAQEAIEQLEFFVAQDIFFNETNVYADVILPAAAFAEKDGTFTNSDRRVQRVRKAIPRPARPGPTGRLSAIWPNALRRNWGCLLPAGITAIHQKFGKKCGN